MLWASQTCRQSPEQWEPLKRSCFMSFLGFYALYQEGKAASTAMRTGKGMRGVSEDPRSSAITSFRGFSSFSNYHTQRHLQDYSLYFPYCSSLQAPAMPFSVHPLYLHEDSRVAANKQSSFRSTLGLDLVLEPETGPRPASNTLRLMIILIIYLIPIKSVVGGWKALFRLRAHQGAPAGWGHRHLVLLCL